MITIADELAPFWDLYEAAQPLFELLVRLRGQTCIAEDIDLLRQTILLELSQFERRLTAKELDSKCFMILQYCLCAALDEAVLHTEWGRASNWGQHTLLSILHHETWGGENFFVILHRLLQTHTPHKALLGFLYVLLCLGYEGQYADQSARVLRQLREQIWQQLALSDVNPKIPLLLDLTNPAIQKSRFSRRGLYTIVGVGWLMFVLLINGATAVATHPVQQQLTHFGRQKDL